MMRHPTSTVLALAAGLCFIAGGAARAVDYSYLYPVDPRFEQAQPGWPPLIYPGPRNVAAEPIPPVDVNDRESVRQFYLAMWANQQFPDFAAHWTGSYAAKNPGDLSDEWRRRMLSRVNAFRALAGVPLFEGTSRNWDDYAQDAAFAESINGRGTHVLTPDLCQEYWTRRAAVGAANGSLSFAIAAQENFTPIDDLVCDYGSGNESVGHRVNMLDVESIYTGIGQVPYYHGQGSSGEANTSFSCLSLSTGVGLSESWRTHPAQTRDRFVAWPSRGWFPLQLLTTARWSIHTNLRSPVASFRNATVQVFRDGVSVPVDIAEHGGLGLVVTVDPEQAWGIHPWITIPSWYDSPEVSTYPAYPGRDVRFTLRVRGLVDPDWGTTSVADYFYTIVVFDALAGPKASDATLVTVPVLDRTQRFEGAAQLLGEDVRHPNGNLYDQYLLTGTAATFRADPGQVSRLSYIDLNDDIVQVEFAGRGRVRVELDQASGPDLPAKYNQSVRYMKGHARVYVVGSDESSYLSVFTVGRSNAVNQGLFQPGQTYDGVADAALVAIGSSTGRMGGLGLGNVSFFASRGFTGVYAPEVSMMQYVRVGEVDAHDEAIPMLLTGSTQEIRIAGGSLQQTNGWPVTIGGAQTVCFAAGGTSHGVTLEAQSNRAVIHRNDLDVTATVIRTLQSTPPDSL